MVRVALVGGTVSSSSLSAGNVCRASGEPTLFGPERGESIALGGVYATWNEVNDLKRCTESTTLSGACATWNEQNDLQQATVSRVGRPDKSGLLGSQTLSLEKCLTTV